MVFGKDIVGLMVTLSRQLQISGGLHEGHKKCQMSRWRAVCFAAYFVPQGILHFMCCLCDTTIESWYLGLQVEVTSNSRLTFVFLVTIFLHKVKGLKLEIA